MARNIPTGRYSSTTERRPSFGNWMESKKPAPITKSTSTSHGNRAPFIQARPGEEHMTLVEIMRARAAERRG